MVRNEKSAHVSAYSYVHEDLEINHTFYTRKQKVLTQASPGHANSYQKERHP
jgi:hypothetical protein